MKILQSLIYGLVSGITEVLPLSAQAHQILLLRMFGAEHRDPMLDLFTRLGILFGLIFACAPMISKMRRERKMSTEPSARRRNTGDVYTYRLLRTAFLPMLILMLFRFSVQKWDLALVPLSLLLLVNGFFLIIPEYMRHGNKDAQAMTSFDGLFIGIAGAASVLPGFSRVGLISAYCTSRGVQRQSSVQWALMLSIPAIAFLAVLDLIAVFSGLAVISLIAAAGWLLGAIAAFIAAYISVMILQFVSVRSGFSGFAYYSFGMALFTFLLYLIA